MPITLEQLLAAKEERQARQQRLREQFGTAIASITLNIPGPTKDSPVLRQLCDYAAATLQSRLDILAMERLNLATGPLALLAVHDDATQLKKISVQLEEEQSFGRLLDIDVFSPEGTQLSRQNSGSYRACLLCDRPAVVCMRERHHSADEIHTAVQDLLKQFLAFQTRQISPLAEKIGSLAVEAMLYEVACTPSPGLVDRVNSGAHRDMDFFSFMSSSAALSLSIARCCEAGIRHKGDLPELLPVLRLIGLDGETAMLTATRGVNTQKGLLFSLGVIVAATGWLFANEQEITASSALNTVSQMTSGIVERELRRLPEAGNRKLTAGERLFRTFGIRGIRGEMEDGLPAVKSKALPALRSALDGGLSLNEALVQTLFVLMTTVEDTTVINRHSQEKLQNWVRPLAAAFLQEGGLYTTEGLLRATELDTQFIEHNVSPGGAADLLAVTWFLHRLEEWFKKQ
jgi:holo-ACP synthase/triphosphoribosyl-dephospho-CoA synthase